MRQQSVAWKMYHQWPIMSRPNDLQLSSSSLGHSYWSTVHCVCSHKLLSFEKKKSYLWHTDKVSHGEPLIPLAQRSGLTEADKYSTFHIYFHDFLGSDWFVQCSWLKTAFSKPPVISLRLYFWSIPTLGRNNPLFIFLQGWKVYGDNEISIIRHKSCLLSHFFWKVSNISTLLFLHQEAFKYLLLIWWIQDLVSGIYITAYCLLSDSASLSLMYSKWAFIHPLHCYQSHGWMVFIISPLLG